MEDGDANCSDVDDEDEENETPQLILKGPEEVKISNSTDITVGNTLNVNVNVNQMLVCNDNPSEMIEGCSTDFSGLLMNLLGNKPSQTEPLKIVNSTSRECLRSIRREEPSTVSDDLQNVDGTSCLANRQSPNLVHVVNGSAVARGKSNVIEVENNELKNTACSYDENVLFIKLPKEESNFNYSGKSETQDVEKKITVYSLIREFVDGINNCLKCGGYNYFEVPTVTDNIESNEFEVSSIKVKGLEPLIPKEGIHVDIIDNLLFVSIPLELENLQLTLKDFSIEWEKISLKSNLNIDIVDNSILINLSTATNEHGHLVNDASIELYFERIQINFDTNLFVNEVLGHLAKNKIKALFFEKYSKTLSHELKTIYTEIAKCVLQCNDIYVKLVSIYCT